MERKKSIWGDWWAPHRKWVYPVWLAYEASMHFYNKAQTVHDYFEKYHDDIASCLGEIGTQTLDTLCSSATFLGCSAFLTVPACFVLYKFFKEDNLTNTKLEKRMKRFL